MSVTAFAAGHLVGGTIWQIMTSADEQIVYAVNWNHRKDRHLKRADLDGKFSRPALLITDACNAQAPPLDTSRRDTDFLAAVTNTLRADGETTATQSSHAPAELLQYLADTPAYGRQCACPDGHCWAHVGASAPAGTALAAAAAALHGCAADACGVLHAGVRQEPAGVDEPGHERRLQSLPQQPL